MQDHDINLNDIPEITEKQMSRARLRIDGKPVPMEKHHNVQRIIFKDKQLVLYIDGIEYEFLLENISKKLANASDFERNKFEISPSGYGIHWPLLDEDLSIDGLLGINHKPSRKREIRYT